MMGSFRVKGDVVPEVETTVNEQEWLPCRGFVFRASSLLPWRGLRRWPYPWFAMLAHNIFQRTVVDNERWIPLATRGVTRQTIPDSNGGSWAAVTRVTSGGFLW